MTNFIGNQYYLLECLFEEELESLYLARDSHHCYYFIQHLKVHKFSPKRRDEIVTKIKNEVETLCKVSKNISNFVTYKTYYIEKEDLYLVQEYVKGETLFKTVQSKFRFTQGSLILTISKLLVALDNLHSEGLVHGQINPNNIVITGNYQPVLVNFDFWKDIAKPPDKNSDQLRSLSRANPIEFNPPTLEINRTPEGDLYSLSLTAIYALTGQLPHALPKSRETKELIWVQQASKVDSKLVNILSQAVHPLSSYHFISAREMLQALDSHLATYGRRYSLSSTKQQNWKKQLSKALPSALVIVLVTTLFLSSVVLGWRSFISSSPSDEQEEVTVVEPEPRDSEMERTEPESLEDSYDPPEKSVPSPSDDSEASSPNIPPTSPEVPEEDVGTQELVNLTLNNKGRMVAQMQPSSITLTFDDGPSPKHTERILDILKQHNIHATFFVVGSRVKKHCPIVKRIVEEGHELGNHTQNHLFLWDHNETIQTKEIQKTQEAVNQCVGKKPQWFRAPYGAQNETTLNITAQLNLNTALWTIDTNDWRRESTAKSIAQEALQAQGRDIILMHDATEANTKRANDPEVQAISAPDRQSTVEALDQIIRRLKDRNLRLVSLSEAFSNSRISHLPEDT